MHSKIFTIAGLSSLAATTLAQDYDHWTRSLSSDVSGLSSLQTRDIEGAFDAYLSEREISEIGSELLARAFGSDEADSAIYASLVGRAKPLQKVKAAAMRAATLYQNPYLDYSNSRPLQPLNPGTGRAAILSQYPMLRRRRTLAPCMSYGPDCNFYHAVQAAPPPKGKGSLSRRWRQHGATGPIADGTPANKKSVVSKVGSGLDNVNKAATGVADVGNKAGTAAEGVTKAVTGVTNAVTGVTKAVSTVSKASSVIGELVEGAADIFGFLLKREAMTLALAHAEAEAEAIAAPEADAITDLELDSWADE